MRSSQQYACLDLRSNWSAPGGGHSERFIRYIGISSYRTIGTYRHFRPLRQQRCLSDRVPDTETGLRIGRAVHVPKHVCARRLSELRVAIGGRYTRPDSCFGAFLSYSHAGRHCYQEARSVAGQIGQREAGTRALLWMATPAYLACWRILGGKRGAVRWGLMASLTNYMFHRRC